MTDEQFEAFWESTYPLSIPLGHIIRVDYAERWFRIHSLPESQRYPNDDADWAILLSRQNALISDLVGDGSSLLVITGEYDFNYVEGKPNDFTPDDSISHLSFACSEPIELAELEPDESEPNKVYKPVMAELNWYSGVCDGILKEIALDNIRLLFISIDAECVIAPYDGGVDVILKDTATRDFYKLKYERWLSSREDGL